MEEYIYMGSVTNLAEYKESKKDSPFDTDIKCGCGGSMWLVTHYHIDDYGNDTELPEKSLKCKDCPALIPLGKEE